MLGGTVPIIKRSEDLEAFDDEFAYVNCEWSQVIEAYEEVVSAFEEFSERHGVTLMPEGPSAFQDGSLLTVARETVRTSVQSRIATEVLGGFYFSRYGRLFVRGPLDRRSRISSIQWHAMSESLANEYGYVPVAEDLLSSMYSGIHSKFRAMTWGERFFAAWYQHLEVGAA